MFLPIPSRVRPTGFRIAPLVALLIALPSQDPPPGPKPLWTLDLKAPSFGSGALADIDGDGRLEVVFGTYFNDRHLYAVNAEDGSVLWKVESDRGPLDASVAIVDLDGDDKPEILIGDSSSGKLSCLTGEGKQKWAFMLPNSTDSPPAVADLDGDGVLEIAVGSMWKGNRKGDVTVLRADNRKVVWSREVEGCVQSEPCLVDLDGDKVLDVIVASWRGTNAVHAFSGKDGKDLWTFETMEANDAAAGHFGMYHGVSAGALVKGGELRIAFATCFSSRGTLYVVDAKGALVWKKVLGEYLFAPTTMADLDGDGNREIIACGANTYVFKADGAQLWKAAVRSLRGPAIGDMDGDGDLDLVLGDSAGFLRGLDGATGRELWACDLRSKEDPLERADHAPLLADFDGDGTLDVFVVSGRGGYGGGDDGSKNFGRAHALRLGKGKGEWTTFRGGLKRTGAR